MLFLALFQGSVQYGPVTHVNIGKNALYQIPDGLREACGTLHDIQIGYEMYWYWRRHLGQDTVVGGYVKAVLGHLTADLLTYSTASLIPGASMNQRRFNQLIVDYYTDGMDAVTLKDQEVERVSEFVLQFVHQYKTPKGQSICQGLTKDKLFTALKNFSDLTRVVKLGLGLAGKTNVLFNKAGLSNGMCGDPQTAQVKKMVQFEAAWAKESMAIAIQLVENQPAPNYPIFNTKVNDRVRAFENTVNGSICNIK